MMIIIAFVIGLVFVNPITAEIKQLLSADSLPDKRGKEILLNTNKKSLSGNASGAKKDSTHK